MTPANASTHFEEGAKAKKRERENAIVDGANSWVGGGGVRVISKKSTSALKLPHRMYKREDYNKFTK